jgi:hypothetical protein
VLVRADAQRVGAGSRCQVELRRVAVADLVEVAVVVTSDLAGVAEQDQVGVDVLGEVPAGAVAARRGGDVKQRFAVKGDLIIEVWRVS